MQGELLIFYDLQPWANAILKKVLTDALYESLQCTFVILNILAGKHF